MMDMAYTHTQPQQQKINLSTYICTTGRYNELQQSIKTQVRLPKTKLVGILDLGGLSYVIPSIAVPVDVSCHAAVRI